MTTFSNGDGLKDPAADVLLNIDGQLGKENPAGTGPIIPDHIPPTPQPAPAPEFLRQAMGQLIDKGLVLSKVAKWTSPAIDGVLTEQEWKRAVTDTSVLVIQKRWPTLANDTTPEFALLVLTLPFVLENTIPWLLRFIFGKSDSDPGVHRDGKNNVNAKPPEPVQEDIFNRSNSGPEVPGHPGNVNDGGSGAAIATA